MLILSSIRQEPTNAQQLSEMLRLDYTTVRHHLRVLEANRLAVTKGDNYGRLYFVYDSMARTGTNWKQFLRGLDSKRRE